MPVSRVDQATVRDADKLQRVADAYASMYDWYVTVRDGAFHDAEGAPTASPPPYDVYEVIPTTAFGFGTDEGIARRRLRNSGLAGTPFATPAEVVGARGAMQA